MMLCGRLYLPARQWRETDAPIKAGKAGDRLTRGLKEIIKKRKLPFIAFNHGSICPWKPRQRC
jgi:hypothetical protein